jgi:hypothetical protein
MTAGQNPRWISAATRLIGSLAITGDRTLFFLVVTTRKRVAAGASRWITQNLPKLLPRWSMPGLALDTTFKPAEQPAPAPSVVVQAAAE